VTFFEPGEHDYRPPLGDDRFQRPQRRSRARNALTVLFSGLAAAAAIIGMLQFTSPPGQSPFAAIIDEPPSAAAIAVADRMFLTEEGRAIFYETRPELLTSEQFGDRCGDAGEQDSENGLHVTGCYGGSGGSGRIVVFQPSDPRLDGNVVTTAAHELLHAAYARLGVNEQAEIDSLTDGAVALVAPENPVHEQIASSVGTHPENLGTERFAYLGTQIPGLDPKLEEFFSRFVADRVALIAVYDAQEQLLTDVSTELDQGYQELAAAEQANANGWAQYYADRDYHDRDLASYNVSVEDYNSRSPEERARLFAVDSDGSPGEPWGSYLGSRLADLDARGAELETRLADLTAAKDAAADLRARMDERLADAEQLFAGVTP
jgi:hypothetical protein